MTEVGFGPKIKSKFLILGITGPLNSGCSTFANFVVREQKNILSNLNSDNVQEKIEFCYRNIKDLLEKDKVDNQSQISQCSRELKNHLRKREVYKILKNYVMPEFYYISLSKMLIKYTIEFWLKSRRKKYDERYKILIDEFEKMTFAKDNIFKIKDVIKKKRYRNLVTDHRV